MRIVILTVFLAATAFLIFACGGTGSATWGDTPTAAYQRLYSAVKSKNTDAIKREMTKKTLDFAQSVAARQNSPIEKVFENGFTATTFADSLPEIRDERVNGDMGAVEVYNSKDRRWEDLPFVKEDGFWKLAIGDLFANTYKSPGKGRAAKEIEAANAVNNNLVPVNMNANGNSNVKPQMIIPKPAANSTVK